VCEGRNVAVRLAVGVAVGTGEGVSEGAGVDDVGTGVVVASVTVVAVEDGATGVGRVLVPVGASASEDAHPDPAAHSQSNHKKGVH